jgi:CheY-like chemotaxis protein
MNPSQYTILVLDDEPEQLEIARRVLSGAGYRVVLGYDGEDARWKMKHQRFDLIITDIAMPRFSGLELIQAIRRGADTACIPVIAVTSYTWELVAETAAGLGWTAFVSKPFLPQTLLNTVEKAMESGRSTERCGHHGDMKTPPSTGTRR